MRRRDLLQALAAAALAGCAPGSLGDRATLATRAALFVPGYHPARVTPLGEPADSHRRRARGGPQTLLTRIGPDGTVRQAVFPVIGHDVAISPDGRTGFLGRMNLGGGEGAGHHVTFDPETLEMIAQGQATGPGWRGGGHGVFLPDGHILCSERAPARPWTGHEGTHHGHLTIRDPATLAVIDSFSCHGIDPHELRLIGDGQVVVANYGSVPPPAGGGRRWQVVAPSVTVLDLASGRLVARHPVPDPEKELRHLALGRDGRILAIRAHQADPGQDAPWRRRIGADVSETPVDPNPGVSYLPAAPVLLDTGTGAVRALAADEPAARLMEGLSVEYDPRHDEFLATFPSSHRLMVLAGDDGRVRRSLDMRDRGLIRPSGLALLPGSDLYVVAGYWQGLHIHERGTHRTVQRLAQAPVTGGHSHMTAA